MCRKLSPSICALALAWCAVWPVGAGEEETAPEAAFEFDSIPKVWIGVRMSEAPEALLAHVRQGRFMLINVAEGSPADQAGLDQYDVVVSFNDRPIEELSDLLGAIQENGADKPGKMVVIHQGAEKTVTVTPCVRDLAQKPVYKFQEDEVVQEDPMERYFGHRLKICPNGKFIFEPQGRLDMLPEDIKTLLDRMQQFGWHDMDGFADQDPDVGGAFSFPGDFGPNASIMFRLDENDASLSIQRAPDGKITVERKEDNGDAKKKEYENEEQLERDDPEAFEIYNRAMKSRVFSAAIRTPDPRDLDSQQFRFQKDLQEEMARVQQQLQKALEESRAEKKRVGIAIEKMESDGSENQTAILTVKDGKIHLTISKDGEQRDYQFENREDFEKSEPELYEKYKQYLDDAELGARFPDAALANAVG